MRLIPLQISSMILYACKKDKLPTPILIMFRRI